MAVLGTAGTPLRLVHATPKLVEVPADGGLHGPSTERLDVDAAWKDTQ